MKYLVRVYRLGDGNRREKDSTLIAEEEFDARKEMAADIGEYAGALAERSIEDDVERGYPDKPAVRRK